MSGETPLARIERQEQQSGDRLHLFVAERFMASEPVGPVLGEPEVLPTLAALINSEVARREREAEARGFAAGIAAAAKLIEPTTSLERPDTTMYSNHDDAERDFAEWSEQEAMRALAVRVRELDVCRREALRLVGLMPGHEHRQTVLALLSGDVAARKNGRRAARETKGAKQ